MKHLLVSLLLLLLAANQLAAQQGESPSMKTQSEGIVILTEKYSEYLPFADTVFVIDKSGVVTTHPMTHEQLDLVQHDRELNIIINGIISNGYTRIDLIDWHTQDTLRPWNSPPFLFRRMFFGIH